MTLIFCPLLLRKNLFCTLLLYFHSYFSFEMASNPEETDNLVNGGGSSVVSIGQTNGSSAQDLENEGKTNEDVTVDHMSSYSDMKNYAKGFVDVALLVKNASQLHQISKRMNDDKGSQYAMDVSAIAMISISIILQVSLLNYLINFD